MVVWAEKIMFDEMLNNLKVENKLILLSLCGHFQIESDLKGTAILIYIDWLPTPKQKLHSLSPTPGKG